MQGTSFEGITWPDLKNKKALAYEILELKRRAEYDADEGGTFFMASAGFNPEGAFKTMDFLKRITRQTTMEMAIATHPHPKERIVHLQTFYTSNSVLPVNIRAYTGLDAQQLMNWKYKHAGMQLTNIHSFQDVFNQLKSAQSLPETMDILKVLFYMQLSQRALVIGESSEAKTGLARELYIRSVIDAMYEVARQTAQMSLKLNSSLEKASSEGLLIDRLTEGETQMLPKADFSYDLNELARGASEEAYTTVLEKEMDRIRNYVKGLDISLQQRLRLLDVIAALGRQAIAGIKETNADTLENYLLADPTSENQWENLISSLTKENVSSQEVSNVISSLQNALLLSIAFMENILWMKKWI